MPVCPPSKVSENEGARDLGFRSEGTFPDPICIAVYEEMFSQAWITKIRRTNGQMDERIKIRGVIENT